MTFAFGSVVPLSLNVTDEAGHATNASSVVCTITRPDGTTETPTVLNPQTGSYTIDYPTVMPGLYAVHWATLSPQLALSDAFDVRPGAPGFLVSLAAAKKKCKISLGTTEHDDTLRGYMEAARVVIEDHLHLAVVRRTETHVEECCWDRQVVLPATPVLSLTSVQAVGDGSTTWSLSNLHVDTETGIVTCLPGTPLFHGLVQFISSVGMQVVPANYTKAALIIIEHLWQTERPQVRNPAPRSAGGYEDSITTSWAGSMGFAIPNRALELLGKPPVTGG